jgi:2-haloacid dehalogenase
MAIEAVVFDIGNVLIEWNPERFYDAAIGEARRKALFSEVDLHAMNERVDRGAPFQETIYETAEQYPDFRAEVRMWFDHWIEMASPEIPHSVKLLRSLRQRGVPVFALSNFGVGSFEYAQTIYPVLGEFDRPYISGYMKVVKPDARIYQMVEEDSGVSPAALLFADDRDDNIAAAKARGWQVHRFEGPQGLADRLVAEGLLSKREAAA